MKSTIRWNSAGAGFHNRGIRPVWDRPNLLRDPGRLAGSSIIFVVIGVVVFSGCVTFQSPKALDPGEVTVGVGRWYYPFGGDVWPGASIFSRYGVVKNLDAGASVHINFDAWPDLFDIEDGHVVLDVKYQLSQGSFMLSPSVGVLHYIYPSDCAFIVGGFEAFFDATCWGVLASVLLGTEKFYGAAKLSYLTGLGYPIPGIMLGASIGKAFKVMPEITIYIGEYMDRCVACEDRSLLVFVGGLGVQYTFGGKRRARDTGYRT